MGLIGNILVKLGLDNSEYKKGLDNSKQQTSQFSSTIKKLGGMMAAAFSVTAIWNFAKNSIKAYNESALAIKLFENALKATGGASGVTSEEIQSLAASLQKVTKFEDDTTIAAAQMLTKFKSIKGDIFKQAIISAQDLATAMNTDLTTSIQQVGRALEDPAMGLSLLKRNGVVFTEEVRKKIEDLTKSGKLYEAQLIILSELQARFGGAAKAAGDTAEGAWVKVKNAIGDVKEIIGSAVEETKGFAGYVQSVAETLTIIAGQKGVSSFTKLKALLGNPQALKDYSDELKKSTEKYKAVKEYVALQMQEITSVEGANLKLTQIQGLKGEQFKQLREELNQYIQANKEAANDSGQAIANGLIPVQEALIVKLQEEAKWVKDPTKLRAINDEIAAEQRKLEILKMTAQEYANFNKYRTNPLPPVTSNIQGSATSTPTDPIKQAQQAAAALAEANSNAVDEFGMTLDDWKNMGDSLNGIIQNSFISAFDALGTALGDLKNADASAILSALISPFADFAISLGTIILTSGTAIENLKAALVSFFGGSAVLAGAALIAVGVAAKAGIAALAKGGSSATSSGNSSTSYSGGNAYSPSSMMQPQTVQIIGKLQGRDIYLSSMEYQKYTKK